VSEEDLAGGQPVMTAVFTAVAASASAEDARIRVRAVLTPEALTTLKASAPRREQLVQQMATDWSRSSTGWRSRTRRLSPGPTA
jgi:hypothetical protein